jgi:acyl-CoA thioester hydrolase
MKSITIEQRVRYVECDPMGFVHHSVYPVWFEMARTELLRRCGLRYADLEAAGVFIVVVNLQVKYKKPARYDDKLRITATLNALGPVRLEHDYEVHRDDELLATASTTLACVDRDGKLIPVPDVLLATAK